MDDLQELLATGACARIGGGDDGVANIFNTTGGTEARQMINDGLHNIVSFK